MQSSEDDRILVMAATNRPEEIDEAALRFLRCQAFHVELIILLMHQMLIVLEYLFTNCVNCSNSWPSSN